MTRAADLAKLIAGGAVFNEASNDVDFRVEGNSLTHALFVDGETDNVMIGTSVAGRAAEGAERLTIADTGHSGMTIRSGTDNYGIIHFSDSEGGAGEYAGQIYYAHGSLGENLVFATQGSNRVKVTADVEIVDGNLKVASGHGIDFSATSDGGSQGFSELLDDYEEGYWTPTYTSSSTDPTFSANLQDGRYTKIGRLVYASFRLRGAISGTKTGNLRISGLPYTANSSAANGSGSIALTEVFGADNYPTNLRVQQSATYINLQVYDSSDPRDGLFTNVTVSSTGTGSSSNYIIGHVVYQE